MLVLPLKQRNAVGRKLIHAHMHVQARQQLKEMVWIKSSENMVLEAMYRLSGLHDALEDLLKAPTQAAEGSATQAAGPPAAAAEPRGKEKQVFAAADAEEMPREMPSTSASSNQQQSTAAEAASSSGWQPSGSSVAGPSGSQPSGRSRVLEKVAMFDHQQPGPSSDHMPGETWAYSLKALVGSFRSGKSKHGILYSIVAASYQAKSATAVASESCCSILVT